MKTLEKIQMVQEWLEAEDIDPADAYDYEGRLEELEQAYLEEREYELMIQHHLEGEDRY